MWRHVEAVYDASPHTGNTHQVLAYLAGRAHPTSHTCYPGNDRIASDLRIAKRTVIRAIQALEQSGCILRITTGNGRGHASIWQLAEQYRPMGDMVSPFTEGNSDMVSPIKEKGDIVTIKGDIHDIKGDIVTIKGDTMSPQRIELNKNNKKEQRENAHTREATAPSPEVPTGASNYASIFKQVTGIWVGFSNQDYLQERLGDDPNWTLLGEVFKEWSTGGKNPRNLRGIFDWYDNRKADPNWQPYQSNGAKPAKANGSRPKTFDQMRQENNLAAIQEARAMMNRSNG